MDTYISLIGFIAATLTSLSFLPQVIKVHRSKHTKDLSLSMFAVFSCGVGLWFVYGILKSDLVIIAANAFTMTMSGYLMAMKLKYK